VNVTAVVLSARPYATPWPGLEVFVHRSTIRDAADLQRARFDVLADVRTSHFFYLDDDDTLPDDYLGALQRCVEAGAPLVYTDEDINGTRRVSAPYSQAAHLRDPLLVHHLALYETTAAREAVEQLPRGHYCPEFMLAWQVAKRSAAYVPEVGYRWNKRPTGMHTWPCTTLSQVRAALWCKANP
jgi:hypothetical protein